MAFIGKKPTAAPLTSSDVADGIITNAKLAQDIISGDTALGATPADTDEFLVSDAGTLKRVDYSYIKGGINMVDQFRLSASYNGGDGTITANWERSDYGQQASFGSIQMSESSGVFSFPSTGFYRVDFIAGISFGNVADNQSNMYTEVTLNNSSYSNYALAFAGSNSSSNNSRFTVASSVVLDITDVSNQKVRFVAASFASSAVVLEGNTEQNITVATFTRLGDT